MPIESFGVVGAIVLAGVSGTIGYYARSFVSKESSARKEDWEQMRALSTQINDLVDASRAHFCNPAEDARERRQDMLKIQGMIKRTNQAIFTFSKSLNDLQATSQQVRLRQAITLLDNSTSPPVAMAMSDPFVVKIEDAAHSLVGCLQLCYFRRYRKRDI